MSKSTSGHFKGTAGEKNFSADKKKKKIPPLFRNGHVTYSGISAHREKFMTKSVRKIAKLLQKNGYEFEIRGSRNRNSRAKIIVITNSSKERNILFQKEAQEKMIDLTTPIIPYEGAGIFKLRESYDEVKFKLKSLTVRHSDQIQKFNGASWRVIKIYRDKKSEYESMSLYFAKNQLFKICLCEDFEGSLPNGIHTGMNIKDAKKIDSTLERDEDWDEVFISPDGYFLEYSNGNLAIIFITIFIPEYVTDEFEDYNW